MRKALTDQLMARLKEGLETAKRLGASAAKLGLGRSERIGCSFENGRLKDSDTHRSMSYGIEVLVDGRKANTSGNHPEDLDELIRRAVELAKAGSAAHFRAYPSPAPSTSVKTHSARTAGLSRDALIESCQAMVDRLKAYDPDLHLRAHGGRGESEGLLATTGGVFHSSTHTHWSLGAGAQRISGTDMLFASFGRGSTDLNEHYDPSFISEKILRDLRRGERIAEAPTGKVTTFLSPRMLRMLLQAVLMGINGRNVAKGDSPLRGRLGEQVLDSTLTLTDDPHLDYGPGAAELDGNGIPTSVLALFDRGVLQRFLYDLDSAGLAGVEPTGNDHCSPHSIVVSPGERTSDELLASIEDGIYLKGLLGFGQSNLMNGDFSANVALGFRIRQGKIVGRIKDAMVAGNVYGLLKSQVQVSSNRDPISRTPYAVIEGVAVSAGK